MLLKRRTSLFISLIATAGFSLLTGCEKEALTPTKEETESIIAGRLANDSIPGIPPIDSIRIDTIWKKYPPKDSLAPKPPKPTPRDTIRRDSVRTRF